MAYNKEVLRKINHYLKDRLGMYYYRRGWLKGDCPYCQEHKFGVNLSMNRSNCFKCEANPKPIEIIMEIEGFTELAEVNVFLKAFEGSDYYEEVMEPYELKTDVVLPDGYRNILRGDSIVARQCRRTLTKRGFNVKDLSRKGWGYCTTGKYLGYLIMPFYINGKLVYFNARKVVGDGPKFNNPLIEDFGIGKNMLIYNVDALAIYDRAFIFESVTNAETIGPNAIATGGKKVSNYQINVFIKSPCEKFVIGLDDDAIEDAIDLAFKLQPYKKVKIIKFPYKKDANDLGRKRTLNLSHKTNYLNYNDIIKWKNQL